MFSSLANLGGSLRRGPVDPGPFGPGSRAPLPVWASRPTHPSRLLRAFTAEVALVKPEERCRGSAGLWNSCFNVAVRAENEV